MNLTTKRQKRERQKLGPLARYEERIAYLFLLPWLIGLLVFWIGPMIASIIISFTDWYIISDPVWVGLANYREMFFEDRRFYQSLLVTVKYIAMSLPVYLIAGLGLSLLLNLRLKGMNIFRTILFVPSVLSGVAVAILWVSLLNPDVGAVNYALREIGIENPPRWLGSPTWAIPSMVIVGLWGVGGGAIIYLAGLQNISPHLYEAATVDGAGPWQKFWAITWPMLTPTMLYVILTGLIGAFQVFDVAYILGGTQGGVGGSLRFYLLYLWQMAFRSGRMGYASALAWVLVVICAVIILVIFRSSSRWVYYETDPDRT